MYARVVDTHPMDHESSREESGYGNNGNPERDLQGPQTEPLVAVLWPLQQLLRIPKVKMQIPSNTNL